MITDKSDRCLYIYINYICRTASSTKYLENYVSILSGQMGWERAII